MNHVLKSWPWFFQAILDGSKKHDLRSSKDRKFKNGDELLLCEFDPICGKFTGRSLSAQVSYITSTDFPCAYSSAVLDHDAVILSLDNVKEIK